MAAPKSSSLITAPALSRNANRRGFLKMRTRPAESDRSTVSELFWIFTVGFDESASGITVQEKSFGNVPSNATRTRKTESVTAVTNIFEGPAVSSTPLGSCDVAVIRPSDCQFCAQQGRVATPV